jgi:hypothetical protein
MNAVNAAFDRDAVDALMVFHDAVPDLRQKGARLWGRCPLHNERTASFAVDPTKKLFYCHGCGAGGDALTLTMLLHRVNFVEAAKKLGAWKRVKPSERAEIWRARQKAIQARRKKEHDERAERELFLEIRRALLLLEAIVRHSGKLLDRVDNQTADSLRETMCICYSLIREFSAGFTLLAFARPEARLDYTLHPERRHQWHERVLARGHVRDERARVMGVLL